MNKLKKEEDEEEEKKLLKMKKWVDLQHAIHNPFYEDQTILDKDADEWLVRLNCYQYPLQRQSQKIKRRYVMPETKRK